MNLDKRYSELIKFQTFEERFRYLKLGGKIGEQTFGYERYLNQLLYHSPEWKRARRDVIIRDNGCDLGIQDRQIFDRVLVHHINPITIKDIQERSSILFDPENLICVCKRTHDAIHYSDETILYENPVERRPNDTCPWK